MSVKSQNVNTVLARLEQTIEQNKKVGVDSGMYLTSVASKYKPVKAASLRMLTSASEHKDSARQRPPLARPQRRQSITMGAIPVGSYRNMLNNDSSIITSDMSSKAEWNPFNDKKSSLQGDNQSSRHSSLNDSCASDDSFDSFGFDEEVDFDKSFTLEEPAFEETKKEIKMSRPAKEKRCGRLGNRKTRIMLEAEASRKIKLKADDCVKGAGGGNDGTSATGGPSEPGELASEGGGIEIHDDEENNLFTVSYVSSELGSSRHGSEHSMSSRKGGNRLESSTHSVSASKPRINNSVDSSSTHSRSTKDSSHERGSSNERDLSHKRREAVAAKPRFRKEARLSSRQLHE